MSETKPPRMALKIAEVAALYGVGREIIDAAIKTGALPAKNVGLGGERVYARVTLADAEAWFAGLPNA